MKKLCLIEGPVDTISGYGSHSRDIVKSLFKILSEEEYDFIIVPLPWGNTPFGALDRNDLEERKIIDNFIKSEQLPKFPDIHLQISIPSEFRKMGKFSIGITAGTETSIASMEFLKGCNKMDLVVVPSKFTKNVLATSCWTKKNNVTNIIEEQVKLEKPIEILFEGINTNIYKKTKEILPSIKEEIEKIKEDFIFLFSGHWLKGDIGHDRKDVGMLIKTFLELFKDREKKPALLLKTAVGSFSEIDKLELQKRIYTIKKMVQGDLPNIYVFYGSLTDNEMNSLYNHLKIKTMISFTHGEGFGRPLLEFSVTGKPIFAPNWSGQIDFLPMGNAILLKGKLEKIDKSAVWDHILLENSEWFRVDYEYAKIKMDMFFNHPGQFIEIGRKQANNSENFTLEKMTERFGEIIKKYYIYEPELTTLKIPKLEKISDETKNIVIPDLSSLEGFKNIEKI